VSPAQTEARAAAIYFNDYAVQMVGSDKTMAYRLLSSATTVDSTMAQGWYGMGNALADLKMLPASITAFRRVLELPVGTIPGDATPKLHAMARVNLGHRLLNEGRIEEAEAETRRAIATFEADPTLDPEGRAFAWTNLSQILSIRGEDEEALRYARIAYEMNPTPIVGTGLAFALLFAGDYAEGLKRFEDRFAYKLPTYLNYPYPRWDGTRVGRVFVGCDQGAGDTLSYTRFLPEVASRVGRVLYQVQSDILRLVQIALAPWPNIEVIPQEPRFPLADAWCPIVSLPVALGLTTQQIKNCPVRSGGRCRSPTIPPPWGGRRRTESCTSPSLMRAPPATISTGGAPSRSRNFLRCTMSPACNFIPCK
jgi:tetratricopeptide (TPR) repeat protein